MRILMFALCVAALASPKEEVTCDVENTILALILEHKSDDGGYWVVAPKTTFTHDDYADTNRLAEAKAYLQQKFRKTGHEIDGLVDLLFTRNAAVATLSLPSAPDNGYIIDTDGRFQGYFAKDGGGWEKWREENPLAYGSTRVSRPAIDKDRHLVLVYIGRQVDWLAGSGFYVLYDYQNGKLKLLSRVMVWVS